VTAELVPVEPFDIVVFGATGDLARRKLIPALFHRWCDNQIPPASRIIAASREPLDPDAYRERAAEFVLEAGASESRKQRWAEFAQRLQYVSVDAAGEGPGWRALGDALDPAADKIRLFYLALPPSIYGQTCEAIAAHGLRTPRSRIVLEKPIGSDFESAREINRRVEDADAAIAAVRETFAEGAVNIETVDGLSIEHATWRLNVRKSNTEPLLRLNIESRGDEALMKEKTEAVLSKLAEMGAQPA